TFILGATTASAAPAFPVEREQRQPDGSTVALRPWGDEHAGGLETRDGFRVIRDETTNRWEFALVDSITGKFRPSGVEVGKGTPPAPPRLVPTTPNRVRNAAQSSTGVFGGIGSIGLVPLAASTGSPAWAGANAQLPFIMVAFSDVPCTFSASTMQ